MEEVPPAIGEVQLSVDAFTERRDGVSIPPHQCARPVAARVREPPYLAGAVVRVQIQPAHDARLARTRRDAAAAI